MPYDDRGSSMGNPTTPGLDELGDAMTTGSLATPPWWSVVPGLSSTPPTPPGRSAPPSRVGSQRPSVGSGQTTPQPASPSGFAGTATPPARLVNSTPPVFVDVVPTLEGDDDGDAATSATASAAPRTSLAKGAMPSSRGYAVRPPPLGPSPSSPPKTMHVVGQSPSPAKGWLGPEPSPTKNLSTPFPEADDDLIVVQADDVSATAVPTHTADDASATAVPTHTSTTPHPVLGGLLSASPRAALASLARRLSARSHSDSETSSASESGSPNANRRGPSNLSPKPSPEMQRRGVVSLESTPKPSPELHRRGVSLQSSPKPSPELHRRGPLSPPGRGPYAAASVPRTPSSAVRPESTDAAAAGATVAAASPGADDDDGEGEVTPAREMSSLSSFFSSFFSSQRKSSGEVFQKPTMEEVLKKRSVKLAATRR
jgi:hypothetical protein